VSFEIAASIGQLGLHQHQLHFVRGNGLLHGETWVFDNGHAKVTLGSTRHADLLAKLWQLHCGLWHRWESISLEESRWTNWTA